MWSQNLPVMRGGTDSPGGEENRGEETLASSGGDLELVIFEERH